MPVEREQQELPTFCRSCGTDETCRVSSSVREALNCTSPHFASCQVIKVIIFVLLPCKEEGKTVIFHKYEIFWFIYDFLYYPATTTRCILLYKYHLF